MSQHDPIAEQSEALVKRLRENGRWYVDNSYNLPLRAAAAIETLQAREAAAKADAEACAPYLKDGETPAECIKRNLDDSIALMELLAAERIKVSNYEKTMQVISESGLEEAKALVAAKEQAERLAEALYAADAVLVEHHGGRKAADPRTPAIHPVWLIIRTALTNWEKRNVA